MSIFLHSTKHTYNAEFGYISYSAINIAINNKIYLEHIKATSFNKEKYIFKHRTDSQNEISFDVEILGYIADYGDGTQEWIWAWSIPGLYKSQYGRSLNCFSYSEGFDDDNTVIPTLFRSARLKTDVNNLFINCLIFYVTGILRHRFFIQKYRPDPNSKTTMYVVKIITYVNPEWSDLITELSDLLISKGF